MSKPPTHPVFVAYVDQSGCGHQHSAHEQAVNCARGLSQKPGNRSRPLARYTIRVYNSKGDYKVMDENPVVPS